MEVKTVETPFKNDIFSMIWKAFKNLYPDKDCLCFWDPMIRDSEDGAPVYGLTDFGDDGTMCTRGVVCPLVKLTQFWGKRLGFSQYTYIKRNTMLRKTCPPCPLGGLGV